MALFFKIKYFECNIGIKLGNTPIAVEQNNCTNKTVNAYVVYDLDNQPKLPLKNFTLKSCLFGATNILESNDKDKYVYSDYGIAFDG